MNIDHLGAVQVICAAAHSHGHVQSARANGQHSQRAACGGMAIAAQQRPARLAHPFQLHLMTDTVARLGKENAVSLRHALDKLVVVRIFKTRLKCVVIYVGNRKLCLDLFHIHSLQLEIYHRTCGILRECLIDLDLNFLTRGKRTFDQMIFQYLIS